MNESADTGLAARLAPNLAVLHALAQTGNVTKAAELLGVPQPTVSRRLAALGTAVGAPLTVTEGRGVRLTRAGELFATTATRTLGTLEHGLRQVREEIDPELGHVKLGFLHLLGRALVPELLRGFRQRHPHVRFSLIQGSRKDILDQLTRGAVDLALVAPLPQSESGLTGFVLAEQELFLAVPVEHQLAGRDRVGIAEFADDEFVLLESGYGLRQITDELCAEAGFSPKVAFEGQESDTVRGLVAAGLGVALLPRFGSAPPAGVVELPLSPRVTRSIGLAWPTRHTLTPAVRAFRDYVTARS
ncbi:LysR family transcriptional regulator [Amycolatopsis marina]|nr:LysR family transcriptional regulator [Amycolatopsis marina]